VSADNAWKQYTQNGVEVFQEIVEKTRLYMIDYVFPQLMDKSPPAERMAFYQGVDWQQLLTLSPYLYQKLSKDALALQQTQNAKQTAVPYLQVLGP
jgi:hypothetical protein